MNENIDQWKWVDEDPFEKLLRAPAESTVVVSEPLRFEEPPVKEAPAARRSKPALDPVVSREKLEPPAQPAENGEREARARFESAAGLEKLNQWQESATAFRRTLEIAPDHAQARIGLGSCLLHLDSVEEALDGCDGLSDASAPFTPEIKIKFYPVPRVSFALARPLVRGKKNAKNLARSAEKISCHTIFF